jgi:hypothetical protein
MRGFIPRGHEKAFVGGETQNVARVGTLESGRAPFQIDALQFKGNYRLAGQSLPPEPA